MLDTMTITVQSETLLRPSSEAILAPRAQAAAVVLAYLANTQLAVNYMAYEVLRELATQTLLPVCKTANPRISRRLISRALWRRQPRKRPAHG